MEHAQEISAGETAKFQQLVADSTFALVLLTNQDTDDWELIEPRDVTESEARTYAARGLLFAGVLSVGADLRPNCKCSVPVADEVVTEASAEFLRRWARFITHPRWQCAPAPGAN